MNSDIQQKLFNYTEAPPTAAWDSIAAALEQEPAYAQKLYAFEVAPPEKTWENVAARLATPEKGVIPLRTKFFKYAIAAAVLGVIAAGSIFYLKNGTAPNLATQPQHNASDGQDKNTLFDKGAQSGGGTDAAQNDVTIEDGMASAVETRISNQALVQFSPGVRMAKNRPATRHITIKPEIRAVIDTEVANRYMIATTANGQAVRLPKKAYSDYACADAYANGYCRERISSIQNQMAASVATDFTEFMDLLKKLQEAQ
jgi:negative regulator of sigma E activity